MTLSQGLISTPGTEDLDQTLNVLVYITKAATVCIGDVTALKLMTPPLM